ncbi:hypothetical protein DL765_007281 [Monosporascus sp. GIB2]|nr:hypothetical protein DL765_007281 [Monosporascus sp. GIB2]
MTTNITTANTTIADGSGMVGWVSPDARRNTLDIILSCLSIFLVCSWKCVHLNLPTLEESRAGWHKVNIFRKDWDIPLFPERPLLRKWGRKLIWMGVISIAPELGVALAVKQWESARKSAYRESHTMTHAFYAQMGGIVLRVVKPLPEKHSARPPVELVEAEPPLATGPDAGIERIKTESVKAVDNNIITANGLSPEMAQPFFSKPILRDDDMDSHEFVGDYIVKSYDPTIRGLTSTIDEEEIADRSKSDAFTKVFAIVQSGWLIVSSIARIHRGHAITELELATMAFIICALVMYIFWWNKPFGVEQRSLLVRVISSSDELVRFRDSNEMDPFMADTRVPDLNRKDLEKLIVDNGIVDNANVQDDWPTVALYLSGITFSAIHVAAWNWEFPTPLIRTIWRAATLTALAASSIPLTVTPWVHIAAQGIKVLNLMNISHRIVESVEAALAVTFTLAVLLRKRANGEEAPAGLLSRGKYEEAEQMHRQALELREKCWAKGIPSHYGAGIVLSPALQYEGNAGEEGDTPAKRDVCRRIAADLIVLLKNKRSVLPLDVSTIQSYGLIGPGVYHPTTCGGGSTDLRPHYISTPHGGIAKVVGQDNVQTAVGAYGYYLEWFLTEPKEGSDTKPLATETSTQVGMFCADSLPDCASGGGVLVARYYNLYSSKTTAMRFGLAVLGRGKMFIDGREVIDLFTPRPPKASQTPMFNQCSMERFADVEENEAIDRTDLELTADLNRLIEAVVHANPCTIVINQSGCPVTMPWVDQADAVLHAWYGGQETGNAMADILFGKVNPSGRLSITFPRRLEDTPAFLNFGKGLREVTYGEGVFLGYRYYEKVPTLPLFYFGHGLSYTNFEYSNLQAPASFRLEEGSMSFEVAVDIRNLGTRDGAEVVQILIVIIRLFRGSKSSKVQKPRILGMV